MDRRKFHFYNRLTATVVFVIAAAVYLLTIEPTASFWDCGEFIASSYRLEVGHPPGNPVFQLFARFFTIFTDSRHAAAAVNALSAICSALTILLLYLTIVFFAGRL
jgi:preprotein translocase subunit SecY